MMACCKSRVPAAGVYLVLPARMAAAAASLMFCGVSKSGSPAPRSTTSTPAARIASAACMAAIVDDAFIRETLSETRKSEKNFVAAIRLILQSENVPKLLLPAHALFHDRRHQAIDLRSEMKYFFYQPRAHV